MKARIGELLRHWRGIRGMSQADLADRAGVSTRHLSFIENGRTQPTRDMLSWLSQALNVPEAERIAFLEAAGYLADPLPTPDIAAHRADLADLVAGLAPHPAVLHDVRGTLLAHNAPFERAIAPLLPAGRPLSSFLDVPSGGHALTAALSATLANAEELRAVYARRVHDSMLRGHGEPASDLSHLFDTLTGGVATPEDALDRRKRPDLLARVALRTPDGVSAWRCVTLTLGPPNDVALRELRVAIFLAAE